MRRFAVMCVAVAWWSSGLPASADVPETMSYQGVLTDGGGNPVPDDFYELGFSIYEQSSGGIALWTEVHDSVEVVAGGFSVLLGSITPLALPFDVPYFLGVTVGADPELTPRAPLASAPYSLGLRLPFNGVVSASDPVLSIRNLSGDADLAVDHFMSIGGPVRGGNLRIFGPSSPIAMVNVANILPAGGGFFSLADATGVPVVSALPSASGAGPGGSLFVTGGPGGGSFNVFGDGIGGEPELQIVGTTSVSVFSSGSTADASVLLPDSAISSAEILDEPGIAQNHVAGQVTVNSTSQFFHTTFLSTSITIPAAGYIVVEAQTQFAIDPGAVVGFQISQATVGSIDNGHYQLVSNNSGQVSYEPCTSKRTYMMNAGTYTFYFQGWMHTGIAGAANAFNPTLTATYYPTSYGSVVETVLGPEAGALVSATPVDIGSQGPGADGGRAYRVDLRELERRIERQREALRRSMRELALARARERRGEVERLQEAMGDR